MVVVVVVVVVAVLLLVDGFTCGYSSIRIKSRFRPASGREPRWIIFVSKCMSVPAGPVMHCGE